MSPGLQLLLFHWLLFGVTIIVLFEWWWQTAKYYHHISIQLLIALPQLGLLCLLLYGFYINHLIIWTSCPPTEMQWLFHTQRRGSPGPGFIGDPVEPLVGNLGFIFLNHVFPHFILMQPHWISISSDKVIYIHSINGGRSLHSLLLAVDKNCHVFLLSSVFLNLLGGCQFPFRFCHGGLCSFSFPLRFRH
jgi:hypothetical protein